MACLQFWPRADGIISYVSITLLGCRVRANHYRCLLSLSLSALSLSPVPILSQLPRPARYTKHKLRLLRCICTARRPRPTSSLSWLLAEPWPCRSWRSTASSSRRWWHARRAPPARTSSPAQVRFVSFRAMGGCRGSCSSRCRAWQL